MGLQPILSVNHSVTIDTLLNKNGPFLQNGLKNVKCEQTFTMNCPFYNDLVFGDGSRTSNSRSLPLVP